MEFRPMGKIPRLSREIVITEKIDGANASVFIAPVPKPSEGDLDWPSPHQPERLAHWYGADASMWGIWAGSRTRWVTPENDDRGWARWVQEHVEELKRLGPGRHFGEWWGGGIRRGYGLVEKRFSLFNVGRWADPKGAFVPCSAYPMLEETQWAPACCHVVPILYRGPLCTSSIRLTLAGLQLSGSHAAPGFMNPEGVVVYHTASGHLYKKTIRGDEEGKYAEAHPPKPKAPRAPRDPSRGGRRIEQIDIGFTDRRKPK